MVQLQLFHSHKSAVTLRPYTSTVWCAPLCLTPMNLEVFILVFKRWLTVLMGRMTKCLKSISVVKTTVAHISGQE